MLLPGIVPLVKFWEYVTPGAAQVPLLQGRPPQERPQTPQLLPSVSVFTQALLHKVKPLLHLQAPLLQLELVGQVFPQAPQLLLSVLVLVQRPEQTC